MGQAYQQQHRHAEALSAFNQALQADPTLAHDKPLRKLIRVSEKSNPAGTAVLPPLPLLTARRVLAIGAVVVLLVGYVGANIWLANHRTLHVVNGFDVPVTVALDETPTITVQPHSWQAQDVAEGQHRAVVVARGETLASEDFTLASSFWNRIWTQPVFVLNAGRGAAIIWEEVVYSDTPNDEADSRLDADQPFVAFDDVDYVFAPFPQTLEVQGSKSVTKTRVFTMGFEPQQIFYVPTEDLRTTDPFAFVERHLRVTPDAKETVQSYAQTALCAARPTVRENFWSRG